MIFVDWTNLDFTKGQCPRRSLRKSLKRREFELDRSVITQLGTEQVILVLGKVLVAMRVVYRRLVA